jgi:hypothetical protein
MKKIFGTGLFFLLFFITAHVFAAGQTPTPEQVVRAFYEHFILLANSQKQMTRAEALKYMTAKAEMNIPHSALSAPDDPGTDLPDNDPGYDYFTKSNDFGDDWGTAIATRTVFQKNKVAIVKTTLGNDREMQAKLAVVLIQTTDGWKISKVFYLTESSDFYE